jgi:hypothetical protein
MALLAPCWQAPPSATAARKEAEEEPSATDTQKVSPFPSCCDSS